jgi:hypothetical protein
VIPGSNGPTGIVAVSLRAPEAAAGSSVAAMASTGHLVKSSLGTWRSIDFHRVENRSNSTKAARETTLVYFTDAESNVCPPLPKAIRGALFYDRFELKEDDDELTEGSSDEDVPPMAALNAFDRQTRTVNSSSRPAAAGAGEAAGHGPDMSELRQLHILKEKKAPWKVKKEAAEKAKAAMEKGEWLSRHRRRA